ncbi:ATP-binding protein [Streptomyces sp. NPDC093707]|uniref:ATP-binding protein n=1 Tax=Streptomyces sp. NPDC093707 TaxID=3154984 RepID=UPI00344B707A
MSPSRHLEADTVRVLWRWTDETPNAASRARTTLQCALDQLGYAGEVLDDAVLAVSELVANALEHAAGPYEMRLRFMRGHQLICEVADTDPCIPTIPAVPKMELFTVAPGRRGGGVDALLELLSERGRGLRIVHHLTRGDWGFTSEPGGRSKVVWMAIPGI